MKKIVLVTGGRAYRDRARVFAVLDEEKPDLLIHGAASTYDPTTRETYGADYFADQWATERRVPCLRCPANWTQGAAGGPIRNSGMVGIAIELTATQVRAASCVAFPGGDGTADCTSKARRVGFPVREVGV